MGNIFNYKYHILNPYISMILRYFVTQTHVLLNAIKNINYNQKKTYDLI